MIERHYSPRDVADTVGWNVHTVYKKCRLYERTDGRQGLRCKRLGYELRIPESAVEALLRERLTGAKPPTNGRKG